MSENKDTISNLVTIDASSLSEIVRESTKSGAREVLREMGLSDLSRDEIHDIKNLAENIKRMRNAVLETFAKAVTYSVIGAIALSAGWVAYLKGFMN
ncbi:MAG: hypothetical protein COA62_15585 [Rhodobiaceae bacterium]|nr:MAG: hypothetical protein COA62_15585 [Rhodobiaceae bacterium]